MNNIIQLVSQLNKAVIVTGVGYGVGEAVAKNLSLNGYHVIGTSRNIESIKNKFDEYKNITLYELNLNDMGKIDEMYEKFKNYNILFLVHNANKSSNRKNVEDDQMSDWVDCYNINVFSAFYLSKKFIKNINKNTGGHIVFINSVASLYPYRGGGHYSSSKRAQSALAESLRLENSIKNIKVTEIIPGSISKENDTSMSILPNDIAETIKWIFSLPNYVNIDKIKISNVLNTNY